VADRPARLLHWPESEDEKQEGFSMVASAGLFEPRFTGRCRRWSGKAGLFGHVLGTRSWRVYQEQAAGA
jgi:hypothetical protein